MIILFTPLFTLAQNIEAEVNVHFPNTIRDDKNGRYVLCKQLRRLQVSECCLFHVPQRERERERERENVFVVS